MQACQLITAEAGYTQQTRPFKQSIQIRGKNQAGKNAFYL